MMIVFEDMMRKKIVMPAHFLRQSGEKTGQAFDHFSDAAQRLGVYTGSDYIDILESLIKEWKIADFSKLTDKAEKARDYLMALPDRYKRVAGREQKPKLAYQFNWIK